MFFCSITGHRSIRANGQRLMLAGFSAFILWGGLGIASVAAQPLIDPDARALATADKRLAIVLYDFLDSPDRPFLREEAVARLGSSLLREFFEEQSYGRLHLNVELYGWYRLPRNESVGASGCRLVGWDELKAAASELDIQLYDIVVLATTQRCASTNGGIVLGGPAGIQGVVRLRLSQGAEAFQPQPPFLWSVTAGILAHELGHVLGASHAEGLECDGANVLYGQQCQRIEYGNWYDRMGLGLQALHFNAAFKERLGWLDRSSMLTIAASGTYKLYPFECADVRTDCSVPRAAKIQPQNWNQKFAPFYLEYRRAIGFDRALDNEAVASNQQGLFINAFGLVEGAETYLLDLSPGPQPWDLDQQHVTLNVGGGKFEDPDTGVTIGPIEQADEAGITFKVRMDLPRCVTHPPNDLRGSTSKGVTDPPTRAGGEIRVVSGEQPQEIGLGVGWTNRDSLRCAPAAFGAAIEAPAGWAVAMPRFGSITSPIRMAPATSSAVSATVTIPARVPVGVYTIRAAATRAGGETNIVETWFVRVVDRLDHVVPVTPAFSPAERVFEEGARVNVQLTGLDIGVGRYWTVYYTLDGTEPTAASRPYDPSVPIVLTHTTTVTAKLVGWQAPYVDGDPVSAVFTFVPPVLPNRSPELMLQPAEANQTIPEGGLYQLNVSATDPDRDPITLTARQLNGNTISALGATWTDHGDGTGMLVWTPHSRQAGRYNLVFSATDGTLLAQQFLRLIVQESTLAISGEVLAWNTGRPVPNIAMHLHSQPVAIPGDCSTPPLQQTLTDSAGRFLFEGIASGRYRVCLEAASSSGISPTSRLVLVNKRDRVRLSFRVVVP